MDTGVHITRLDCPLMFWVLVLSCHVPLGNPRHRNSNKPGFTIVPFSVDKEPCPPRHCYSIPFEQQLAILVKLKR